MTEYRGCKYYSIQEIKEGKIPAPVPGLFFPTVMVYINTDDSDKSITLNTGIAIEDIVNDNYTEEEFEKLCKESIDIYLEAAERKI